MVQRGQGVLNFGSKGLKRCFGPILQSPSREDPCCQYSNSKYNSTNGLVLNRNNRNGPIGKSNPWSLSLSSWSYCSSRIAGIPKLDIHTESTLNALWKKTCSDKHSIGLEVSRHDLEQDQSSQFSTTLRMKDQNSRWESWQVEPVVAELCEVGDSKGIRIKSNFT